jgi:hypothetical protein
MPYINPLDRKTKLRNDITSAFNGQELTTQQLWALVKLSKFVRLRARNNSAFNNLFNELFPHATFKQVTKTRKDGTTYPGLSIQVGNQEANAVEEDNEE